MDFKMKQKECRENLLTFYKWESWKRDAMVVLL
jgi:hypothetical protein